MDYQEMVEKVMGNLVTVKTLTQQTNIVCKDIDEITTKQEVIQAIQEQFQMVKITEAAIRSLRPAYGGTQVAVLSIPSEKAKSLIQAGKVNIGWTVCRLREYVRPRTCYRCLGYGHMAQVCKNADRSKRCRRCGEEGHLAKICAKEPKCMLCEDSTGGTQNHIAGSSRCPKYRSALKQARG